MTYSVQQEPQQIVVTTPELEIGFSRESGALTMLRRPHGTTVIGYGPEPASLDIRLASGWMSQRFFARYLAHQVAEDADGVLVTIRTGIGPLLVHDYYRVTGTLLSRTIVIKNVSLDDLQLTGVWLALPWARIGALESCRFEAPASRLRPRLPLSDGARLRRNHVPEVALTPLSRRERLFESCPDRRPGLLGLHSISEHESLLCWYYSEQQPAWPAIEGDPEGSALTMGHEVELAGWMRSDEQFTAGVQYVMLVQGAWAEALQAFQDTWHVVGLRSTGDLPPWLREAAIYETHPALHGGFRGLTDVLPRLQALGVTVLNLMPIWAYENRSGKLWDGNWAASGSPYAIVDFERFEPTLGSAADFRALVERAHQLGMRVLLDLVLQGCAISARYVAEHPDWFCRDGRGRLISSHGWSETYSFDWANENYQAYMLDWPIRFAREYGIDGYRISAPAHKEPNWNPRLSRPASATSLAVVPLLKRLRHALKQVNSEAALLCELGGPVFTAAHELTTDVLSHLMFYQAGLGRFSAIELGDWLEDAARTLPPGARRICFTESHSTHADNPLADALHGSRLSKLLLAMIIGCGYTPMLWYGQEQGQEHLVRRLLALRRACPILREGEAVYNAVPCDVPQILNVLRRLNDAWLLCVFNLGPHRRVATLSLPVDRCALQHQEYSLRELIDDRLWVEHGRQSWHRDELLQLAVTVEPYGFYFFALTPGPVDRPSVPQQHVLRLVRRPKRRRRTGRRLRPRRSNVR